MDSLGKSQLEYGDGSEAMGYIGEGVYEESCSELVEVRILVQKGNVEQYEQRFQDGTQVEMRKAQIFQEINRQEAWSFKETKEYRYTSRKQVQNSTRVSYD